ncbi:MAG: non-canonical purine NTP pyrophosphatase, partial [Bacillota bacterium]
MKQIFFGTGNISKLKRIRTVISDLPLEILGPDDLNIKMNVVEDGKNVRENALKKAKAYYAKSNIPAFAIDSGLYLDKFPEEKQPGIFVRRINGKRATDKEMREYYKKELEKVGGISKGKWISAFTFVLDESNSKTYELEENRIFTSKMSSVVEKGLPLSSLAIDPDLNKYVAE